MYKTSLLIDPKAAFTVVLEPKTKIVENFIIRLSSDLLKSKIHVKRYRNIPTNNVLLLIFRVSCLNDMCIILKVLTSGGPKMGRVHWMNLIRDPCPCPHPPYLNRLRSKRLRVNKPEATSAP